jgi:DNA mismatch repair protein MutS2
MVKQGEAYNYVDASEPKQKVSPTKSQIRTAPIKSEINLLGQTVDEALYNVDKFLDDALMQGVAQVRIIHGRGTGKLKNGIHSYLRTNKNVAEYRLGNYNEGDSGVTIVTLK